MASASTSTNLSTSLSATENDALKAAIFQRLHPRVYLERFLAERVRPDGRAGDEWRDIDINVGSISTANGSALVRMGNTTVVCGVKAEIAEPELDKPNDGFLVPNIDLPAICSSKFKPGPPSEEAQVLSERLNDALVESKIIPRESLCIHPSKYVWALYVDATCINYDGNAFDAALLAMVSALKNTILPEATYDETTGRTVCYHPDSKVHRGRRLEIDEGRLPIGLSFGVFEGTHILADPTSFEEPLLDTMISVIIDSKGLLNSVNQAGVGALNTGSAKDGMEVEANQDALLQCVSLARKRHEQLKDYIYGG
ncbi:exosome component 8 [Moniliophthora roreri MCA 2997]|uniref:Ribosomal RNA-processing protein 43 n=2 Tax=Moniliophthora roreri TaxID=221103 RepID=V2YT56_MONRO|nr:exosome component 8 [Moniliophthora roreri MCA 2997]KAI3619650.1 exosome component 8 [Moniliophthora roreri]